MAVCSLHNPKREAIAFLGLAEELDVSGDFGAGLNAAQPMHDISRITRTIERDDVATAPRAQY
jgi:hypothetical protein